MKTITDAVNEFKAEWPDHNSLSKWQFEYHVAELTGCPIKLKQWQDSKMNKAIKDAYKYLKGDLDNSRCGLTDCRFVHFDKDVGDYVCFRNMPSLNVQNACYQYICTVEEFINYSKSVEVKPVYTKAMQDAGEQIKAGMKFRTEAGEYIAELVNGLSVCFTDEFGFFVAINISLAKGIDTRTDKEKAIDDLFNLDELICNDIKWHENFLDGIIAGKITGVTWAGK